MSKNLLIFTACLVGLLSAVGMSLPYPILAPLFADGSVSNLNHFLGLSPKFLLGLALAINPLGILMGSSILGPLSDRHGRRTILLATIVFSAIGHLAVVAALVMENYPMFLLARFVTGLAEGNTSLINALLADEIDGEQRVRAFALFNGANYGGWLLGPLIAGATVQFGITVPFSSAAIVLLLTFGLGWMVFPKHAPQLVVTRDDGTSNYNGEANTFGLLRHRAMRQLFILNLARTVGVTAFYEYFPLLLVEQAKLGAGGISIVSGVLCAVMMGTSALVGHGWLRTGGTSRLGLFNYALAALILLSTVSNPVIAIGAMVLFGVPNALYTAVFPAYCSERYSSYGNGTVLSLLSNIFCISNVIVALIGSGLTVVDTRLILVLGAATTLWAGWRITPWIAANAEGPGLVAEEAQV